MVALLFDVGGQRYALDVAQVLRVVPYVHLRRLPAVPEYIAGVFLNLVGVFLSIFIHKILAALKVLKCPSERRRPRNPDGQPHAPE